MSDKPIAIMSRASWEKLVSERDTLKSEVERLKGEMEIIKRSMIDADGPDGWRTKDRDAWKAKAEKLAGALRDLLNHGLQYENGEVHQADPDKAKEALTEFEK